ncbi:prepilin-type N-terminal cleavage/methylation domain-containing protein [bacterium]|nr:prepilin-type N-terminal cleavage/methylation domain-containing protein [bacterium]
MRKTERRKKAFTLVEVMVALSLLVLILLVLYRLFFAGSRSIKIALEHISVNENARLFLSFFGNDVRNAVWINSPSPSVREGVPQILPAVEGKFCEITGQVFDFSVKPPDTKFLKTFRNEWHLKKSPDGTFEVFREIFSDIPPFPGGVAPYHASRMVCQGVKEIKVFSSLRRTVKFSSFLGLPFKNFLIFEPYEIDGTGPYLVHVHAVFVRTGKRPFGFNDEKALNIRTSFAIRGRMSFVNP